MRFTRSFAYFFFLIIFISLSLHFLFVWLGTSIYADWRLTNLSLHSGIEMMGAMVALMVAYLLITLERMHYGTNFNYQIAMALIAMGVLDGMHAIVPIGQNFVWLHSLATLMGGLFFLSVYLPPKLFKRHGVWAVKFSLFLSLALGTAAVIFPNHLPDMAQSGGFTKVAILMNVMGGVMMLLAAGKLTFTYYKKRVVDDLLFVLHCAMFGLAAIMFQQSVLWDLSWWGWHLLRFMAYGVALWFAIGSDLLRQRRVSEALEGVRSDLEISELKSETILSHIVDAVVISDLKGKIIYFSKTAEAMFGIKDALGKNVKILMPESIAKHHDGYLRNMKRGFGTQKLGKTRDLQAVHAGGEVFPVEIVVSEFPIRGTMFFLALIRDITDRKGDEKRMLEALESAEKANESKSLFLANMSHEIRTPMNAIMATLQLVRPSIKKSDEELIENALTSCESLLTIINDILDLSKIEQGHLSLEEEKFDLFNLLSVIEGEMKSTMVNKAVEFDIIKAGTIPRFWRGDVVRVRQILLNMINNALKFTEQGFVTVTVMVKQSQADRPSELIFQIEDSGMGMDKEGLDKLFEYFEQADNSITRTHGGTGLGMAITKSLVDMMGGRILVTSEKGIGTCFNVHLPLQVMDDDKGMDHSLEAEMTFDFSGHHILIVEDNPVNTIVMKRVLSDVNIAFDAVIDGQSCLAWIEKNQTDCILMDVHMPNMDGKETTQILRQQGFDKPIIACTADVMNQSLEAYHAGGFDDCVAKPLKIKELYSKLSHYLK